MHGLETIKRMNKEASIKEQNNLIQDIADNQAILKSIADDVVKQLTRELKLAGSITGRKIA